jgi:hypothetical protein
VKPLWITAGRKLEHWLPLGRWIGPVQTLGCLLDGFHHLIGGKVVDHVAETRKGNEPTLRAGPGKG